jgi:hypothetical protein
LCLKTPSIFLVVVVVVVVVVVFVVVVVMVVVVMAVVVTPCKIGPYFGLKFSLKSTPKSVQTQLEIDPIISPKMAPKLALNHPKICRNTYICVKSWNHGRMARGGHGLPTVPLLAAIPYASMPCRWAIPETPYGCFRGGTPSGWATCCQLLPL